MSQLSRRVRNTSVGVAVALVSVGIATKHENYSGNGRPVRPAPTGVEFDCPEIGDELANDKTIVRRLSPAVRLIIENEGAGQPLNDGTVDTNLVAVTVEDRMGDMDGRPLYARHQTVFIHNFGEHAFRAANGEQFNVDVNQPPAAALAIDPQAADILICPEK